MGKQPSRKRAARRRAQRGQVVDRAPECFTGSEPRPGDGSRWEVGTDSVLLLELAGSECWELVDDVDEEVPLSAEAQLYRVGSISEPAYRLRAAASLVDAPGFSHLDRLRAVAAAQAALDDLRESVVGVAHHVGSSWAEIGEALGITAQGAHRKYAPKRPKSRAAGATGAER